MYRCIITQRIDSVQIFEKKLLEENWNEVKPCNNANEAYVNFFQICTFLYNDCSPKFKIRPDERKNLTIWTALYSEISKRGVLLSCVSIQIHTILQPDVLTSHQPKYAPSQPLLIHTVNRHPPPPRLALPNPSKIYSSKLMKL